MSLIEFEGVSRAFFADGKRKTASIAVCDLNLQIERGEFVSIIGPSGCGKTVTLSMLAGFDSPTLGQVRFKGEPVKAPGPERGVVFQQFSLMPWLTVRDNVLFSVKNSQRAHGSKLTREQMMQRVSDALETVGLGHVAQGFPNKLSGGMQQRVAIARLLAMDSEVFLMDEPFSALDEETRHMLDVSLHELWKASGKTVVFITHNISEAVLVSSRVVMLSASPGRITGEWAIPADLDRDLNSPELQRIAREIRSQLTFNSRQNATGIE